MSTPLFNDDLCPAGLSLCPAGLSGWMCYTRRVGVEECSTCVCRALRYALGYSDPRSGWQELQMVLVNIASCCAAAKEDGGRI